MSLGDAKDRIRDHAAGLGFDAVGFARADLPDEVRRDLEGFLTAGHHGDMAWMAREDGRRGDPHRLWPAAVTVVVLGVSYAPAQDPRGLLAAPDRGVFSTYARGRDYHDVIKGRLKRLAGWMQTTFGADVKVFVDTAPVMEKPLAETGGLGWQGRHTNLVSRQHGSWLFLGEVFTTLDLTPDPPHRRHCGSCRACRDVCPTGAIIDDWRLDARRCVSYLTIEHKGPIPRALRPGIGNRVYGCDDCLAVCPWNRFAVPTREPAFLPRIELTAPRLADLARLDAAGFAQVFAGSPVKRIGRDRLVRNVLIAIGNGPPAHAPAVAAARDVLADPSPLVRAAAVWALSRLLDPAAFARVRAACHPREADAEVAAEWEGVAT